jgi:hypothetical protein
MIGSAFFLVFIAVWFKNKKAPSDDEAFFFRL